MSTHDQVNSSSTKKVFVKYFLVVWIISFSNTVLQKWVHAIVEHNPCKVKQQRVCSKYKPNVDSCINWLPSRPSFSPCTPWPSMKKFRVDSTYIVWTIYYILGNCKIFLKNKNYGKHLQYIYPGTVDKLALWFSDFFTAFASFYDLMPISI